MTLQDVSDTLSPLANPSDLRPDANSLMDASNSLQTVNLAYTGCSELLLHYRSGSLLQQQKSTADLNVSFVAGV